MRLSKQNKLWMILVPLLLTMSWIGCSSNPPAAMTYSEVLALPQISPAYEALLTTAGEETYKAAYRHETSLNKWAYYTQAGEKSAMPKASELAELLKKGSDELKREAIKHELDWQGWAKKAQK